MFVATLIVTHSFVIDSFGKVFLARPISASLYEGMAATAQNTSSNAGRGSAITKLSISNRMRGTEVFAVKVLKKLEVEKRNQVQHTKTERNILSIVNHRYILPLRCSFQTPERLYIVTDYCPGGELFYHLKRMRRFTENMMRFYAVEIVDALGYLHQLGELS